MSIKNKIIFLNIPILIILTSFINFIIIYNIEILNKEQLINNKNEIIISLIIVSLIFIAIVIIIGIIISNKIVNPLMNIIASVDKITKGNLDTQLEIKGKDEIAILAKDINAMASSLKENFKKIEEQNQELEKITEDNKNIKNHLIKQLIEMHINLEKIEEQNKQIKEYNEQLEKKVKERTEELGIANNELSEANKQMQLELQMAQKIQQSIIPKIFPKFNLLNFSGEYIPMEKLGGDLYDVFKISPKKVGFVILDVCGHGVPASLITMMAKVSFYNNSIDGRKTNEIVDLVHKEIYNIISDIQNYFTAFYCIIDDETGMLEFTNAGHNDMFILKKDGEIRELKMNSPCIGIFKDVNFHSDTVQLEKYDKVILYTDGVHELRNSKDEIFGIRKLKNIITENKNLIHNEMISKILSELNIFKGDGKTDDDITLFIIDVN